VVGLSTTKSGDPAPRQDVAFVEELIGQKVFAEQRLAQRTQKGILVRNQLIRRLQVGLIVAAALLAIALPWTAERVDKQAQVLRDTMVDVTVSGKRIGQAGCLDTRDVYQLLQEVASLDTRTRYLVIPLSWVDRRVNKGVRDVVAKQALEQVILPAMACSLQKRIDSLSSVSLQQGNADDDPATADFKLLNQVSQLLTDLDDLENELDRFAYISSKGTQLDRERMLQDFSVLADYIYGKPLPPHLLNSDNILADALVKASYLNPPKMTDAGRTQVARELSAIAAQAQHLLLLRVQSGIPLLATLQEEKPPVLPQLRRFNAWMDWVRGTWLTSTPTSNPCSHIVGLLQPELDVLINKDHYDPSLRSDLDRFNTQQCYQPAVDSLRGANLAPYGALFVVNAESNQLQGASPELYAEARGLSALVDLDYMQLASAQPYRCNGGAGGWRSDTFGELSRQMRQYLVFAAERNISPLQSSADNRPLFDRLARGQLEIALGNTLARNQRTNVQTGIDTGMDATSPLEQMIAGESANFAQAVGPYLESLRRMRQLGMQDLANEMDQCGHNYAADMLQDISGLAASSHLYDPSVLPQNDNNGTALFDLGSTAVLQSYLARQQARAQVLAGYASPFVTLLKNSSGVNDSQRTNVQSEAYWDGTINELNRQLQFADPAGQVAQLNDFFLKQLGTLNYDNCANALNTYAPPQTGNDLFSQSRMSMLHTAQVTCTGNSESDANLHFVRIAALFNSQLAGRYPFGPSDAADVSPAVVKAFFVYYANEKPTLETWLANANSTQAAPIKSFIGQLDAVQAFFAGNLLATQSAPMTLAVAFRALPADSPFSNQMIGWTLRVGSSSASWPGTATAATWHIGDPVSLDLQWADLSRYTPLPDASQSDLHVSGYHSVFQFTGSWALLRLNDMHKAAAGTSALDPSQQLLQFQVPVLQPAALGKPASTTKAPFYMTVTLSAPDPASKAMATLTMPVFPRSAPSEQ
jgi:type VI secretion system protein ImpL